MPVRAASSSREFVCQYVKHDYEMKEGYATVGFSTVAIADFHWPSADAANAKVRFSCDGAIYTRRWAINCCKAGLVMEQMVINEREKGCFGVGE